MDQISVAVMQTGCYGIYKPGCCRGDELVKIWFCGAWKVRRNSEGQEDGNGQWVKQAHHENHSGIASMPCVHATRRAATECRKAV